MSSKHPDSVVAPHPKGAASERQATKCLEECRLALSLAELPLPIPVDEWIELALGIRFEVSDLLPLGYDEAVLGVSVPLENRILVSEQLTLPNASPARYRFTCAHELGHVRMHRRRSHRYFRELDAENWKANALFERQANRFAAAFLMPLPLVMRELFRVCDHRGLSRRETVASLMSLTDATGALWRQVFLPELTRRFGVSFTTAVFRFSEILLHGKEPFMAPAVRAELLTPPADRKAVPVGDATLFDSRIV